MHNYSSDKENAIQQMLEMNKRATQSNTHTSGTPNLKNERVNRNYASSSFMHLPIDTDTVTILLLMYILYNENCDKLLLLALAYILI